MIGNVIAAHVIFESLKDGVCPANNSASCAAHTAAFNYPSKWPDMRLEVPLLLKSPQSSYVLLLPLSRALHHAVVQSPVIKVEGEHTNIQSVRKTTEGLKPRECLQGDSYKVKVQKQQLGLRQDFHTCWHLSQCISVEGPVSLEHDHV